MSPTTHKSAQKWARVGAARLCGAGLWIACDGKHYAVPAADLAAFLDEGETATIYQVDPDGADEPREVGSMDLSGSGRMVLVRINGEDYLGRQLPAADLAAHVARADRRVIPVMAPPPSTLTAVA